LCSRILVELRDRLKEWMEAQKDPFLAEMIK
jgi:hypothetical protein